MTEQGEPRTRAPLRIALGVLLAEHGVANVIQELTKYVGYVARHPPNKQATWLALHVALSRDVMDVVRHAPEDAGMRL
jgi:hypothetical protein